MSQTGSYITTLVWETSDAEGPTRAEYQTNWNAMDGHLHDNRGAGRGIRAIQTATAPAQAGDVQLTGDSLKLWGATSAAVLTLSTVSPSFTGGATFTQASAGANNITLSNSADATARVEAATANDLVLLAPLGHSLEFASNNATQFAVGSSGGFFANGVTGGDKGAGTVNATNVYVNGTPVLTSAPASNVLVFSTSGNTVPAGTTDYIGFNISGTESVVQIPLAEALTFTKMYTNASVSSGAAQSFTYTLRKNGLDTAITSSITNGTTSNDTAHSVTFAAGDLVDIKVVTSASAGVAAHHIMLGT